MMMRIAYVLVIAPALIGAALGAYAYLSPETGVTGTGGALLATLIAGGCVLSTYALHGAMPYNPIKLPFESEIGARYWIPQGWKFFTKSPHDENMLLFSQGEDGQWASANLGPIALP